MIKPRLKNTLVASLVLAGMIPAAGMALDIKEGKWALTTTATDPISGQPTTETTEECIMGDYDPIGDMQTEFQASMAQMGGQCEVEPVTDTDDEVEATIMCSLPDDMGSMNGTIHFAIDGDNATGKVAMSMDMGGMSMEINADTVGEYLGACD